MLNFSNSNEDKKTKGKANNITESNVGTCVRVYCTTVYMLYKGGWYLVW